VVIENGEGKVGKRSIIVDEAGSDSPFFPLFSTGQPTTNTLNPQPKPEKSAANLRISSQIQPFFLSNHCSLALQQHLVGRSEPATTSPNANTCFSLSAFLSIQPSITSIYRLSLSSAYCPLPAYCSPEPVFLDLPCT